jgi:hypothetical protein
LKNPLGYLVVMDEALDEAAIARILDAIACVKGVVEVHPVSTDYENRIAVEHEAFRWREAIRHHTSQLFREMEQP